MLSFLPRYLSDVHPGQFKYPAVQRYLHDLTSEMADHLDTITSSLSMFLEIGTLVKGGKHYYFQFTFPTRYSNDSFRAKTRCEQSSQPYHSGDLFLCCHCDHSPVLIR